MLREAWTPKGRARLDEYAAEQRQRWTQERISSSGQWNNTEVKYFMTDGTPVYGNADENVKVPAGRIPVDRYSNTEIKYYKQDGTPVYGRSDTRVEVPKDAISVSQMKSINERAKTSQEMFGKYSERARAQGQTRKAEILENYQAISKNKGFEGVESKERSREMWANTEVKYYDKYANPIYGSRDEIITELPRDRYNYTEVGQIKILESIEKKYENQGKYDQAQNIRDIRRASYDTGFQYQFENLQTPNSMTPKLRLQAIVNNAPFSTVYDYFGEKYKKISDKYAQYDKSAANYTMNLASEKYIWELGQRENYARIQEKISKNESLSVGGYQRLNPFNENAKFSPRMIKAAKEGKTFEEYTKTETFIGMTLYPYKTFREQPLKFPLIAGGAFAFSYASTAVAATGTVGATTSQAVGYGLLGAYAFNVQKQFKNAPTNYERGQVVAQTVTEATLFGAGAKAGSQTALYSGFIPKPSALPTVRTNKFQIENEGKTQTLFRNFEWYQPSTGRGGNIVGYGQGRIYFGKPTLDVANIQAGKVVSIDSPTSRQIIQNLNSGSKTYLENKNLGKDYQHIIDYASKDELLKFKQIMEIAKLTYKAPSKSYNQFEKVESFKTQEGFNYYVGQLKGSKTLLGTQANINYGFGIYKTYIRGETRLSGDIDTFVIKSEGYTSKFAESKAFNLNYVYKDPAFYEKAQPFLIQTTYGGRSHKGDLHPIGVASKDTKAAENLYGIPFDMRKYNVKTDVGNIKGFGVAFGTTTKAASILQPYIIDGRVYFAPESHRMKDVGDFFVLAGQSLKNVKSKYDIEKTKALFPETAFESPQAKVNVPEKSYNINAYSLNSRLFISPTKSQSSRTNFNTYSKSVMSSRSSRSPFTSPSISPMPSLSQSPSPSRSPSPSPSPSLSPSPSPSRSPSPSPSPSLSPSPSPSRSPSPSPSPSLSPPLPPRIPPFTLFKGFGDVTKKLNKANKWIQPKAYKPNLYSAFTGFTSNKKFKQQKIFTGAEIRGL